MKITIIGPGIMSIPPKGWGAVESLIWDYGMALKKMGHKVIIVNTQNYSEIIENVNKFDPDFVHLQYDNYADVLQHLNCKNKAVTSHFGYIEQYKEHPEYNGILNNFINGDFYIFCLSKAIKEVYLKLGVRPDRLFVTPNGSRDDLFKYETNLENVKDKSIYLAKIDYRKRQYLFQDIPDIDFAGNNVDYRFNTNSVNYLGEWTKEFLYENLTHYSNLVLLSDGEADPLVTKEALMCGLGLVISEYATANLDTTLPFISVVPESKISDLSYISRVIEENRKISRENRNSIRQYALENFKWDNLIIKYLDLLNQIIF